MSSPSNKRDLYEFNDDYLDDLNAIRRRFNLVELTNDPEPSQEEPPASASGISLPENEPSAPSNCNFDLYEFDATYINDLNSIRKKFQLSCINLGAEECMETLTPSGNCDKELLTEERITIEGSDEALPKELLLEERITLEASDEAPPPLKKICTRDSYYNESSMDSSTNEFSSTEDSDQACKNVVAQTINSYRERGKIFICSPSSVQEEDTSEFTTSKSSSTRREICSPYIVPSDDEEVPMIIPKVIVVTTTSPIQRVKTKKAKNVVEPLELLSGRSSSLGDGASARTDNVSARDNWRELRGSLDLPRITNEKYDFPEFADITKWMQKLTKNVDLDKICPKDFAEATNHQRKEDIFVEVAEEVGGYAEVAKELLKDNEVGSEEVQTVESLSNMQRCKQNLDMKYYDMETSQQRNNESPESDESETRSGCHCFRLCFVKKRKKYFSA